MITVTVKEFDSVVKKARDIISIDITTEITNAHFIAEEYDIKIQNDKIFYLETEEMQITIALDGAFIYRLPDQESYLIETKNNEKIKITI